MITFFKSTRISFPATKKFCLGGFSWGGKLTAVFLSVTIFFTSFTYYVFNHRAVSCAAIVDMPLDGPLPMIKMHANVRSYDMALLKGIEINPANPFDLSFYVDGMRKGKIKEKEMNRLIKYFLGFLAIPNDKVWVNLSPYERDRIIPDELARLDIGKDFLLEDYLLKQLSSALTDPQSSQGKQFWKEVYKAVYALSGKTNIPVNSLNKVWIIPDKAVVSTYKDKVFVKEAKLKVMMEDDYVAAQHNQSLVVSCRSSVGEKNQNQRPMTNNQKLTTSDQRLTTNSQRMITEVFRRDILPLIEKQVNESKAFAPLRQMYYALILATYFKKKLRQHVVYQYYIDQEKTAPLKLENSKAKEVVYQSYLARFRKGIYRCVRNDYDPYVKKKVKRSYFSGGLEMSRLNVVPQPLAGSGMKGEVPRDSFIEPQKLKIQFFTEEQKETIKESSKAGLLAGGIPLVLGSFVTGDITTGIIGIVLLFIRGIWRGLETENKKGETVGGEEIQEEVPAGLETGTRNIFFPRWQKNKKLGFIGGLLLFISSLLPLAAQEKVPVPQNQEKEAKDQKTNEQNELKEIAKIAQSVLRKGITVEQKKQAIVQLRGILLRQNITQRAKAESIGQMIKIAGLIKEMKYSDKVFQFFVKYALHNAHRDIFVHMTNNADDENMRDWGQEVLEKVVYADRDKGDFAALNKLSEAMGLRTGQSKVIYFTIAGEVNKCVERKEIRVFNEDALKVIVRGMNESLSDNDKREQCKSNFESFMNDVCFDSRGNMGEKTKVVLLKYGIKHGRGDVKAKCVERISQIIARSEDDNFLKTLRGEIDDVFVQEKIKERLDHLRIEKIKKEVKKYWSAVRHYVSQHPILVFTGLFTVIVLWGLLGSLAKKLRYKKDIKDKIAALGKPGLWKPALEYLSQEMENNPWVVKELLRTVYDQTYDAASRRGAMYLFGEKQLQKAIPCLISVLGEDAVNGAAADALVKMGNSADEALEKALIVGTATIQTRIIDVLLSRPDSDALQVVSRALEAKENCIIDHGDYKRVISAFGEKKYTPAIPVLIEALQNEIVAQEAGQALIQLGDACDSFFLETLRTGMNQEVKKGIVKVLSGRHDQAAIVVLIEGLLQEGDVLGEVEQALAQKGMEVVDYLVEVLSRQDMGGNAAHVLVMMGKENETVAVQIADELDEENIQGTVENILEQIGINGQRALIEKVISGEQHVAQKAEALLKKHNPGMNKVALLLNHLKDESTRARAKEALMNICVEAADSLIAAFHDEQYKEVKEIIFEIITMINDSTVLEKLIPFYFDVLADTTFGEKGQRVLIELGQRTDRLGEIVRTVLFQKLEDVTGKKTVLSIVCKLKNLDDLRFIPALLQGLKDEALRNDAKHILIRMGKTVTAALCVALHDEQYKAEKEVIVEILGNSKDSDSVEPLIGLLGDGEERVRAQAQRALTGFGQAAVPQLIGVLEAAAPEVKKILTGILLDEGIHDEKAVLAYVEAVRVPAFKEKAQALLAQMAELLDKTGLTARNCLIDVLEREKITQQGQAEFQKDILEIVFRIKELGDIRFVPFIIEALRDNYLCDQAKVCLIKLGRPAVPCLIDALDNSWGKDDKEKIQAVLKEIKGSADDLLAAVKAHPLSGKKLSMAAMTLSALAEKDEYARTLLSNEWIDAVVRENTILANDMLVLYELTRKNKSATSFILKVGLSKSQEEIIRRYKEDQDVIARFKRVHSYTATAEDIFVLMRKKAWPLQKDVLPYKKDKITGYLSRYANAEQMAEAIARELLKDIQRASYKGDDKVKIDYLVELVLHFPSLTRSMLLQLIKEPMGYGDFLKEFYTQAAAVSRNGASQEEKNNARYAFSLLVRGGESGEIDRDKIFNDMLVDFSWNISDKQEFLTCFLQEIFREWNDKDRDSRRKDIIAWAEKVLNQFYGVGAIFDVPDEWKGRLFSASQEDFIEGLVRRGVVQWFGTDKKRLQWNFAVYDEQGAKTMLRRHLVDKDVDEIMLPVWRRNQTDRNFAHIWELVINQYKRPSLGDHKKINNAIRHSIDKGTFVSNCYGLGIDWLGRFNFWAQMGLALSSFSDLPDNLEKILINRIKNEPDERPLAVLLYPKSDWNGGLIRTLMDDFIDQGYRVMYYETGNIEDWIRALKNATGQGQKASVVVVAGHGSQGSVQLGENDRITLSDKKHLRDAGLSECVVEGGKVILSSCSTGKGEDEDNVVNMLCDIFRTAEVIGPLEDCYIHSLEFDSHHKVTDVIYAKTEWVDGTLYWFNQPIRQIQIPQAKGVRRFVAYPLTAKGLENALANSQVNWKSVFRVVDGLRKKIEKGEKPGKEYVPSLQKALMYKDSWSVRECAAEILGEMQDRDSIQALITVLNDGKEESSVIDKAAKALGKIGDKQVVGELKALLERNRNGCEAGIEALGAIAAAHMDDSLLRDDIIALLRKRLKEISHSSEYPEIIMSLGTIASKAQDPEIKEGLIKDIEGVIYEKKNTFLYGRKIGLAVIDALGLIGGERVVPAFIELLNVYEREVFSAVIGKLISLHDECKTELVREQVCKALEAVFDQEDTSTDKDGIIRKKILEFFGNHGDKKFVVSIAGKLARPGSYTCVLEEVQVLGDIAIKNIADAECVNRVIAGLIGVLEKSEQLLSGKEIKKEDGEGIIIKTIETMEKIAVVTKDWQIIDVVMSEVKAASAHGETIMKEADEALEKITRFSLTNDGLQIPTTSEGIKQALASEKWVMRRAVVEALGVHSEPVSEEIAGVVCEIVAKDKNYQVRAMAAQILGKIGKGSEKAMQALAAAAKNDKVNEVRLNAIRALGLIRVHAALPVLIELAGEIDKKEIVESVNTAIDAIGPASEKEIAWIKEKLAWQATGLAGAPFKNNWIVAAAMRVIANTGESAKTMIPLAIRMSEGCMEEVCAQANAFLARAGIADESAVPELVAFLAAREEKVRLHVLEMLAKMGAHAQKALPHIIRCCIGKEPGSKIYEQVVKTIDAIGPASLEQCQEILSLAVYQSYAVKIPALHALGKMGKAAQSAVPVLLAQFKDAALFDMDFIYLALHDIGISQAHLPQMQGVLSDKSNYAKQYAIILLSRMYAETADEGVRKQIQTMTFEPAKNILLDTSTRRESGIEAVVQIYRGAPGSETKNKIIEVLNDAQKQVEAEKKERRGLSTWREDQELGVIRAAIKQLEERNDNKHSSPLIGKQYAKVKVKRVVDDEIVIDVWDTEMDRSREIVFPIVKTSLPQNNQIIASMNGDYQESAQQILSHFPSDVSAFVYADPHNKSDRRDVFGFADCPQDENDYTPDVVGVSEHVAANPSSLFHEKLEYMVKKGIISAITMTEAKNQVTLIFADGKKVAAAISHETWESLRREDTATGGENHWTDNRADWFSQKKNAHYAIRVLQRQMFKSNDAIQENTDSRLTEVIKKGGIDFNDEYLKLEEKGEAGSIGNDFVTRIPFDPKTFKGFYFKVIGIEKIRQ